MALFYGWGSAALLESLWGDGLLFTTKFPEIPGTHLIDLRRMKYWVDLGATQWFGPVEWESNGWNTRTLLHPASFRSSTNITSVCGVFLNFPWKILVNFVTQYTTHLQYWHNILLYIAGIHCSCLISFSIIANIVLTLSTNSGPHTQCFFTIFSKFYKDKQC